MKNILIVEDDDAIAMALEDDFKFEGYEVMVVQDGISGLELAMARHFDIILLDVMLPGMNGLDVCKALRSKSIDVPIILLTAKGQEIDKILGLEFGADDYVTKPFSPRVLQARVKAILRRTANANREMSKKLFRFGDVIVDTEKYLIMKNGRQVKLTALEFSLLKYFLENHKKVLSRDKILDDVWAPGVIVDPRTVDTHIAKLRKKLEDDPSNPKWIIGIRGIGYKLV